MRSTIKLGTNPRAQEGAPKNPRAAAEAIVGQLPASPLVKETSLAGPGFINVRIAPEWLGAHLTRMVGDGIASWAPSGLRGKKVVVDFRWVCVSGWWVWWDGRRWGFRGELVLGG